MTDSGVPAGVDRRTRRRVQTLGEILDRALEIMARSGVSGLTIAALARDMDIQPPSLYKYYPSLEAVYDALFRRGQQENLDALREGMAGTTGLAAIAGGLTATARWAVDHPVLAQLLFWRPVPGYVPAIDALAPTLTIVESIRAELHAAVAADELGPGAASEEAMNLLSSMHFGVISQHLANDPDGEWGQGRFIALQPRVIDLFALAYPPKNARKRAR